MGFLWYHVTSGPDNRATLNRNTKSRGGIIGFSLKQGPVQRWLMTAHERAAVVDICRQMAGLTSSNKPSHKEFTNPCYSRMTRHAWSM